MAASSSTEVTKKDVSFIDENEDLSTIPKAKVYSENPDLMAMKPKKKGPVRIMAPTLINKLENDDEKSAHPRPIVKGQASQSKSGLLSMLPPPKGVFPSSNTISNASIKSPSAVKAPLPKPSLVPRSLSRKPEPIQSEFAISRNLKNKSNSKKHDSDDEESDIPFFTMDSKKESFKTPLPNPLSLPSSSSVTVRSNPEAAHPKGIEPGSHPRYGFDLQI